MKSSMQEVFGVPLGSAQKKGRIEDWDRERLSCGVLPAEAPVHLRGAVGLAWGMGLSLCILKVNEPWDIGCSRDTDSSAESLCKGLTSGCCLEASFPAAGGIGASPLMGTGQHVTASTVGVWLVITLLDFIYETNQCSKSVLNGIYCNL